MKLSKWEICKLVGRCRLDLSERHACELFVEKQYMNTDDDDDMVDHGHQHQLTKVFQTTSLIHVVG